MGVCFNPTAIYLETSASRHNSMGMKIPGLNIQLSVEVYFLDPESKAGIIPSLYPKSAIWIKKSLLKHFTRMLFVLYLKR